MKEITLSCHLFRDIEAGSENFEIKILTSDISFRLHDKIMQHLKEKHNTMFSDIKSSNLELWKVNISNDNEEKFSKLVLKNDDNEGIQNIWGMISDYWEEQPSNGFTHVIIDSPYLTTLRKLKALTTGDSGRGAS